MPFEETRGLLKEVLPVGEDLNCQSIRQNLQQVAERLEEELGEEREMFFDEAPPNSPLPQAPLTVGLDGGYLHNYEQKSRQDGWFEVIVGKSEPTQGPAKRFAFVRSYDDKPKRRLFEVLKSQGMNPNQLVTFLSDGGETVRNLPAHLNPQAEHLLDWFHITMRLTVMGQTAKGMRGVEQPSLLSQVESELESLKWHLWNGDVRPALEIVEGLKILLAGDDLGEQQRVGGLTVSHRFYWKLSADFLSAWGRKHWCFRLGGAINAYQSQLIPKHFGDSTTGFLLLHNFGSHKIRLSRVFAIGWRNCCGTLRTFVGV
jgi:hypothetical protein